METKDEFIPVAFDGNFLLTDGKGKVALAVWAFGGHKPPTDADVRDALKKILEHSKNDGMRPMTYEEVELFDSKQETRQ